MTGDRVGNGVVHGPGGGVHQRPGRLLRLAVLGGLAAVLVAGGAAAATVATQGAWSSTEAGAVSPSPAVGRTDPASGGGTGQPSDPGWDTGEFPDASTTGVPDGVTLQRSGTLDVEEDGAIIENLLIVDGSIEVWANDVTIRNVRITNEREFVQWGIAQREGYSGLTVEDSEIYGNVESPEPVASGISNHGGMMTVRRVEIHTITDGIVLSHGLVEDSYLHSPRYFDGDHTDMIQANGGPEDDLDLVIRHNTVINTEDQTGAISLFDNFWRVQNVLIEQNLLAGGGYTFYGGGYIEDGSDPANIVVRDNVFSRRVFPDCGYWGPVAYFDDTAPGNLWEGNVWEDDGSPVLLDEYY